MKPRGKQALHGTLTGGRAAYFGPDAYNSQMNEYERRTNIDALRRSTEITLDSPAPSGYVIITTSRNIVLPASYQGPLTIKNASGSSFDVSAPATFSVYGGTVTLADGDAHTFIREGAVWYTV